MGLLRLSDALRELDGFFEGAVGGGDGKFLTTQSAGESQPFGSGERRVFPNCSRTESPVRWPRLSLIDLKWSRSSIMTAIGRCAACWASRSSCDWVQNAWRLSVPVRAVAFGDAVGVLAQRAAVRQWRRLRRWGRVPSR